MYYECICIIWQLFDQLIMNLSEFRYIGKLSIQEKVGMKYQHRVSRQSLDSYKNANHYG